MPGGLTVFALAQYQPGRICPVNSLERVSQEIRRSTKGSQKSNGIMMLSTPYWFMSTLDKVSCLKVNFIGLMRRGRYSTRWRCWWAIWCADHRPYPLYIVGVADPQEQLQFQSSTFATEPDQSFLSPSGSQGNG